jgi:hypothetical protein
MWEESVSEIPAPSRRSSHQTEISVPRGMVVSHDQLMHLRLEWFVRQPRGRRALSPRRAARRPLPRPSGSPLGGALASGQLTTGRPILESGTLERVDNYCPSAPGAAVWSSAARLLLSCLQFGGARLTTPLDSLLADVSRPLCRVHPAVSPPPLVRAGRVRQWVSRCR